MKKLMLLTLCLLLFCSVLLAQADTPKDKAAPKAKTEELKKANPERPMQKCLEDLKLTDAQKKKWEELKTSFEKTKNTLQAEIKNLKIDLRTALKNENFQNAKELNKQIAAKRNALDDAKVDFLAARMKELTSEQKATLKKHLEHCPNCHNAPMQNKKAMQMRHSEKENCNNCGECGSADMPTKINFRK